MSGLVLVVHPDTATLAIKEAAKVLGFEVKEDAYAPTGKVFILDPDAKMPYRPQDWR